MPVGTEFRLHGLEAQIGCSSPTTQLIEEEKCLAPEGEYRFRIVTTNADNPSGEGDARADGAAFKTLKALEFEGLYATAVGTDAATLHAVVNPLGIPTTGYFEYVNDADYQASGFAEAAKVPDSGNGDIELNFGSGEAGFVRGAIASPLEPGTTYHYRLRAIDLLLNQYASSEEKTFATFAPARAEACPENEAFRIGASALLPDCRAYELVSPVDKKGGDIVVLNETQTTQPAVLNQSAASGEKVAYGSYRAFGDAQSAPVTSQYIATRGATEWRNHGISPPETTALLSPLTRFDNEFRAFSAELCDGWLLNFADPPLAEGAPAGQLNLYRRADSECGGGGYEALITEPPSIEGGIGNVELQGLSADGSEAVFMASGKLTPDAPDPVGESPRLYAQGPAGTRFLCVLPDNTVSAGRCAAGGPPPDNIFQDSRILNVHNAVSADGQRVFWTGSNGAIYLRENPFQPDSARLHGSATGTGDLTGPAICTGNLNTTATVKKVECSIGSFAVGQEITAPEGIPAGTTVTKIEEEPLSKKEAEEGKEKSERFILTLSKSTTKVKTGSELTGPASEVVPNVVATSGAFAVGQEISTSDGGIPAETTIMKVEEAKAGVFKLTFSAKASKTEAGATLVSTSSCTEADKACTLAVSRRGEKLSGTNASRYWGAADDGGKAIYSTGDLNAGKADLYEFDVGAEATHLIAGGVFGLVGMSEDASRVYLVSSKAGLGGSEGAVEGKPNLYFYESGEGGGSYRFIATLAAADAEPGGSQGIGTAVAFAPGGHAARVSPDGLSAAFISASAKLAAAAGYDNTDAASGKADTEVYLYDATASEGVGELRCVSCNPGGARPQGAVVKSGNSTFWVAARIAPWENGLYPGRNLSSDGTRLYFDSFDPLVARDTNGRQDVYQWERVGSGGCDAQDAGFSPAAGGCVDLISSGQSANGSSFLDASPSGDDVFFTTLSSLLPQDPGLLDVYDARAGGGLPPPPSPPPACEGEACQSAPEAPDDPTPASATFEGAGNVAKEASAGPRTCTKGKVRRQGKCVARKHKRHRGRANRNRGAGR